MDSCHRPQWYWDVPLLWVPAKVSLEITFLKLNWNLPGANELKLKSLTLSMHLFTCCWRRKILRWPSFLWHTAQTSLSLTSVDDSTSAVDVELTELSMQALTWRVRASTFKAPMSCWHTWHMMKGCLAGLSATTIKYMCESNIFDIVSSCKLIMAKSLI